MPEQLYDIDLKLLRVFQEVSRQESFSLAAEALGTSLSNVSMNISQLESRVGMRLCERGVKGFRLTEQGRGLLEAGKVLQVAMREYQDKVDTLAQKMHREFRIGVLSELVTEGTIKLDEIIAGIESAQPDSTFYLEFGPADELREKIDSGELHYAIGYFGELDAKIQREPLVSQRHLCYCSKNHHLFARADEQITEADLQGCKIAGYDDLFESEKDTVPLFAKYDSCSRTGEGILALVLSGGHIGLLVETFATPWVERGVIRPLRLAELALSVDIELIYSSERLPGQITETLLEVVRRIYPVDDVTT